MSDVRASAPKIVRVAGEVRADDVPANTPRSYLTLSVAPEFHPVDRIGILERPRCHGCVFPGGRHGGPGCTFEIHPVYSGALAVERLDRILRAERDPITPELLREKLGRGGGHVGGLARRLEAARAARAIDPSTESELRAMWGDR